MTNEDNKGDSTTVCNSLESEIMELANCDFMITQFVFLTSYFYIFILFMFF